MNPQTALLFAAMEAVFCITPGPAVLMVMAYGFRGGFRAAFMAAWGIEAANTVFLLISAAGLGVLVAASPLAFTIFKWTGAGYLLFLGARMLWRAGRSDDDGRGQAQRAWDHPFLQALITQFANPKAILIFAALLPQFLDLKRPLPLQYLILWAIGCVLEIGCLSVYALIAGRGGGLVGPGLAVWRERVSGLVLIAVGALFLLVPRSVT